MNENNLKVDGKSDKAVLSTGFAILVLCAIVTVFLQSVALWAAVWAAEALAPNVDAHAPNFLQVIGVVLVIKAVAIVWNNKLRFSYQA